MADEIKTMAFEYSVPCGAANVTVVVPTPLDHHDVAELEEWFALVIRSLKRRTMPTVTYMTAEEATRKDRHE